MFDITIVGGGHAGVEAAYIASQFPKLKIAIITMPGVGLASAPCNPSIGGVGKGQVVREIDALGGLIGKLADMSGIQYRTLNESKGFAVQSTRVQIDKVQYSVNAEKIINEISNIDVIKEKVIGLMKSESGFEIKTTCSTWNTKKLIITVGTFLNGKMHTGIDQTTGGRVDCDSSDTLSEFFKNIKTVGTRFKTGTPARLNKNTIDYSQLEVQPSDERVNTFHVLHGTNERYIKQVNCYLAYTNEKTMNIIRENKHLSPMFNGQVKAVGARYCPSIEDKAFRYPDKNVHHVFVEPESHEMNTVYPSGISTSLPKNVQLDFIQTISGLEETKIEEYGYAVEYDVIDTTQLNYSLEFNCYKGLYFAGQVNGTSGYEEAAGQGFIAGANAALSTLGEEELVISRKDSYIGVMIEDLISNVRDEPYRLFTARSENRLSIREDNSALRMHKYRKRLGLSGELDNYLSEFEKSFNSLVNLIETNTISPDDSFLEENNIKVPRNILVCELIKQSSLDPIATLSKFLRHCGISVDSRLLATVAISNKYSGYINRADEQNKKLDKLGEMPIEWKKLCDSENISFECRQRIQKIKPTTFGQLKLIEGIRPATLAVVASHTYQ